MNLMMVPTSIKIIIIIFHSIWLFVSLLLVRYDHVKLINGGLNIQKLKHALTFFSRLDDLIPQCFKIIPSINYREFSNILHK